MALPHLRKQRAAASCKSPRRAGSPGFSLYHATKWGIEGFVESVRQEVAPFGIGLTLVEPGPTRTNFGASLVTSGSTDACANTPVGDLHRAFSEGSFDTKGDPGKMIEAMIASVEQDPAPRRLTFGATAYASIRSALQGRLAELENRKDAALAMDIDP